MKWTRKLLLLAICLCVVLTCALMVAAENHGEVVYTGTFGTLTYTFYSDGYAQLEGTGALQSGHDFPVYDTVWLEIGEGITEIGSDAFNGCTYLESVKLPSSLRTIGANAFNNCTSLKSVDLPEGLVNIGSGAFFDAGLTSVKIPDSVTSLAYDVPVGESALGAFDCPNLKKVTLGKGITAIPWGCFSETPIQSVVIPETVTRIDNYAFGFCRNLTSVTIPKNVAFIGWFAFGNTNSLTNVVFMGDAPQMDSPFYCASFNGVAFYPKGNPTWEKDLNTVLLQTGGLMAAIPYTMDSQGNLIPEVPSADKVENAINWFASQTYAPESSYPSNYSYILNGDMLKVYGEEAFAFEVSDACFGYLPISEKRSVSYDALHVGDILYSGSDVWVITGKTASGVELAGVQDGKVCYGVTMTKAQVQSADAYRTRAGVSPYPGQLDPALSTEKVIGPGRVLTEKEVYDLLVAQQAQFPQGMPYSEKNHYHCNVTWYVDEGATVSQDGHGCSAFSGYLSDLAFGDLPARYFGVGEVNFDSIMVGDRLFTAAHEMIVLEVYSDCVVVAEGNYNGRIHWGRTISRQEIENEYSLVTRYPEAIIDQLKNLIPSDASAEEIRNAVQSVDQEQLIDALKTDGEITEMLIELEEKAGGPAKVEVEDTSVGIVSQDVQIVGANLNNVSAGNATLVIAASEKSHVIPEECEAKNAVRFSMTLENVADTESLAVPVKVTLPVPQNVEPARLVILHYHGGSTEQLKPAIETIGGKYYASVVLSGFSDFAMVQRKHTYSHIYDYNCDYCGAIRTVDMTRPMVDMFRMYDPNSGEHFYTGSMEERENLVAVGWHYEGVGFTFPLTTGKPVHRLYEPITGEHLYTMDENEMNMLLTQGWNYEGIAFNSGFENEVPQYRLHNPNATRGAYHFTASIEERDFLISVGWEYQGIGWYSLGG